MYGGYFKDCDGTTSTFQAPFPARMPWSTAFENGVRISAPAKDRVIGPATAAMAMKVFMTKLETTATVTAPSPTRATVERDCKRWSGSASVSLNRSPMVSPILEV